MSEKNKNRNTILIAAGIVILLGIGGYFFWSSRRDEQEEIVEKAYSDLLFATGTSTILGSSYGALDELAEFLITSKKPLQIVGHTDSQGSDSYNQKLSENRATAVMNYLVQKGVPTSQLTAFGKGETMPIADNNTAEGRELNRRVEFIL